MAVALVGLSLAGCNDFWVGQSEVTENVWEDDASGLVWQDPSSGSTYDYDSAVFYCDGLSWAGYDDWRLATIGDLRSLIRGCAATAPGGACGADEFCSDGSCRREECGGCTSQNGPGTGGCYWDAGLSGSCGLGYWSSSSYAGDAAVAWVVYFSNGYVGNVDKVNPYDARCVRGGP
ncbi:MAG: DUF1566 domain-containing protein [Verrucomicrobia bacterium]|nr:DUF1566 domain-containing protein [Verrucomicrobiota bacterium]